MDILRTWIDSDTKQERAKLYRNIDPESICVIGHRVYFAHPGTWDSRFVTNRYRIHLTDCSYLITDPVEIKEEMKRFDFPSNGDLGYCNHTAELKNRKEGSEI